MKNYLIFTILLSGLLLSGCAAPVGDGTSDAISENSESNVSVVTNEDGSMKIVKNSNSSNIEDSKTEDKVVEDTENNDTESNTVKKLENNDTLMNKSAVIKAPVGINAGKLTLLTRENDGFKIGYPKNWYYNVDHSSAKLTDYELIVGFASTSHVWEMERPYPVELIVIPDDVMFKKLKNGYSKKAGETEGKYYMLASKDAEYKSIIDLMAESFELINN